MKTPAHKAVDAKEALLRLQRLCAMQEKCLTDVRKKMRSWGLSEAEAEDVERRLLSEKFVDEARYAAAFAREKARFSRWGVHKIRAALHAKKIGSDLVEAALREAAALCPQDDFIKALQKKAQATRATSPQDMFAKLVRFGVSRGYEYEDVVKAASEIVEGIRN
ncbi:MAG: RecX family transcriptional regulator [Prevotellaceae bacterium]|jgi:regulatory protein|nr:RecX family transcriptional regulator [Prevotellaceae bacterium]